MPAPDSTTRFSNRVSDYIKYRPDYPQQLMQGIRTVAQVNPSTVVADIGSGTGISSDMFLREGCSVLGIEPNQEMRAAADSRFQNEPRFRSIAATAETTTLESQSVDIVIAGQAFHWFDAETARREFARILRPKGCIALFWNTRRTDSSPFMTDYEHLLNTFGTDYKQVRHEQIDHAVLRRFFAPVPFQTMRFPNSQSFDFEGLKGRLLSSSYAPPPGHPFHDPMLNKLKELFVMHASHGLVHFTYDTELYIGVINN